MLPVKTENPWTEDWKYVEIYKGNKYAVKFIVFSHSIYTAYKTCWSPNHQNYTTNSNFQPVQPRIKLNLCRSVSLLSVQNSLLDLKEHASSLASSGLKKDSKLKTLEIALEQRREECSKLENQLKRVREGQRKVVLAKGEWVLLLTLLVMVEFEEDNGIDTVEC